jgi:AraC-like DNA-binding protein
MATTTRSYTKEPAHGGQRTIISNAIFGILAIAATRALIFRFKDTRTSYGTWKASDANRLMEHVAVSRATLERRFRRVLGRSPKAEIERVRLERAKRLLSETPYKLHQIAITVGYQTAAQFAIAFKRQTGLTPGQYRTAERGISSS